MRRLRDLIDLLRDSMNSPGFWLGFLVSAYLLWNARHNVT
jgi:hypothetical protein